MKLLLDCGKSSSMMWGCGGTPISSSTRKVGQPEAIGLLAAAAVLSTAATDETLSNIPPVLSGECAAAQDCKRPRIQRPKSRKSEACTIKCVTTCIRGGEGSPGEGPLNVRRPLVVFKQGFRTRQYCLVECSDICNLLGDADDGP